eukprot:6733980-Pyramimonas_sp.AAC.1
MGGGDDFADTHDVKADEIVDGRIGVGAVTFTKKAAQPAASQPSWPCSRDSTSTWAIRSMKTWAAVCDSRVLSRPPCRPSRGRCA